LTAVAGNAVANLLEPGQLFGVDMDHVARLPPLVSLHRNLGLEVAQPSKPRDFMSRPTVVRGAPTALAILLWVQR
jgi:hypothetical protein